MTLIDSAHIATIVSSCTIIIIAIQFYFNYKQLKNNYEMMRRHKAVDLLVEWGKGLKKENALARKILEGLNAEQCREIVAQQKIHVTSKLKGLLSQFFKDLEKSKKSIKGDKIIILTELQSAELRWHAITYLNSLESILVAWQYSIVDREIIENEFGYLFSLADGHEALKDFRLASGGENSYPAIEVFANHIKEKRKDRLVNKLQIM